ncbi:hypothetical protein P153DRAFT_142057 [Dothidotthia symphoricarpi CBS 119687]|uniref:Rhodopsin domain-containing protein n=1 Tax=Dothidotthia symphoricarpi CBS 119687 TaxID=1392245 RepID=A0A6A5ZY72_9PLEO|nr:uncharacterized protein P153DRAFT_142057 [Dothidotthia symphoricarpi CBS 119687]KAF2123975.1 hypothetical protein P153DRAFT_142057 [Dothidotthia symphoricarpi CBS 119687]
MSGVSAYLYSDPRQNPDNANLPTINRPETILGVTITFMLIAAIAISLRLWVRFRDRTWGWDDIFLGLAVISNTTGDILVCMMTNGSLGLHFWTLDSALIISYFKDVYISNVIYCSSATLIKLAILFQYLRLFAETAASTNTSQYRLARRIIISTIVLTILWGGSFVVIAIFPCHPIEKNWNIYLEGSCFGFGSKDALVFFPTYAAHSASNMALDVLILLLPIPFLKVLRLAGKRRAGLITLFILGTVVVAVSIGRVISLVMTRAGTFPTIDMTYHTTIIYLFTVLEINIAILCASVPVFWPILTSLAFNRILVVNEVIIRVEENSKGSFSSSSQGIKLTSSDDWPDNNNGKNVGNSLPQDARSKRLNALPRVFHRSHSKLSSKRSNHEPKHSASSSIGRVIGRNPTLPRHSQDSERNLTNTAQGSHESMGDLTPNSSYDYYAELDRQHGSTTRVDKGEPGLESLLR